MEFTKGKDIIKWIQDNHAEELPVVKVDDTYIQEAYPQLDGGEVDGNGNTYYLWIPKDGNYSGDLDICTEKVMKNDNNINDYEKISRWILL